MSHALPGGKSHAPQLLHASGLFSTEAVINADATTVILDHSHDKYTQDGPIAREIAAVALFCTSLVVYMIMHCLCNW